MYAIKANLEGEGTRSLPQLLSEASLQLRLILSPHVPGNNLNTVVLV